MICPAVLAPWCTVVKKRPPGVMEVNSRTAPALKLHFKRFMIPGIFFRGFYVTICNFTGNHSRKSLEQMTENISDETIMQNVKNGNLAGMSVLFERYHLRLFNFFLKMGLKRDISQDLTQNLFYRLLKYRNSYKEGNDVRSWIYQIARNLHADHCNQQKKSDDLFKQTETLTGEINDESDIYGEEEYEKLDIAFSRLSDTQKEILILSRYQGLKHAEIASITNQSVPAIKVAIHRAIKQLRCVYMKQI
jgi:RNA polymerase sigma-70 factor (ECF subfamily)